MKTKRLLLIVLVLIPIFALALTSCADGITGDEAKAHIEAFFGEVEAGNFEEAEAYLHSERPASLQEFFDSVEESEELDFQSGIEVKKYTGFSTAYYDSSVQGSTYSLNMIATVGDKEVDKYIEIVRNDNGFGIYNFKIDT